MENTRFTKCISRLRGTQLAHKYPVTREHVVRLLRLNPTTLTSFRNKGDTITLTVGCQRPSEAAAATSCDWWFDDDWHRGLVSFQGGATLNCSICKQDQECKGHHMRFGRSEDPALDLVHQMGLRHSPTPRLRETGQAPCHPPTVSQVPERARPRPYSAPKPSSLALPCL